jgi:2-dehydropantoate 2-reductase
MRIAIFGSGAVGGYFGGRLAQAAIEIPDLQVIFIARGEQLDALRSSGLRVDSILGDFTLHPVQATNEPVWVGPVDAVLVCVKAWQVPEAAAAMQPLVGPETTVVYLGNGVDAPAQLAAVLGHEHVLGGLCRISARLVAPGYIRHIGIQPFVALGELTTGRSDTGQPSRRVQALCNLFEAAAVKTALPADIQAAMWEKFVFISATSSLGAITRAPFGVLRSLPECRQMLEQALREVAAVGLSRRVNLPDDLVPRILTLIDGLPPETMASMQRDILEGRPSELGAQTGAVVRMGLESGTPTPLHSFMYDSLLPQELAARSEIAF